MTMNKFYFNEHKQDTWKCDWLIGHIISIMELCVSGVNIGFDNPSMSMEEDGDNLEGVI